MTIIAILLICLLWVGTILSLSKGGGGLSVLTDSLFQIYLKLSATGVLIWISMMVAPS